MKLMVILLFIFCFGCNTHKGLPEALPQEPAILSSTKYAFDEWFIPAKQITEQASDPMARRLINSLAGQISFNVPKKEGEFGPLGLEKLSDPANIHAPWVRVVIAENSGLSEGWKKELDKRSVASFTDPDSTILLSHYRAVGFPRVLRGLILMHEMRHWYQLWYDMPIDEKFDREMHEIDAYEFEQRLFKDLNLPNYARIINEEMDRVRQDYLAGKPVKQGCPLSDVKLLFPDVGDNADAISACQKEIFYTAMFRIMNAMPWEEVMERKIKFVQSSGK